MVRTASNLLLGLWLAWGSLGWAEPPVGADARPGESCMGTEPPLDAPAPPCCAPALPIPPAPCPADPPTPVVTVKVRVPACAAPGQELEYRIFVENCSPAEAHHV